MSSRPSRRNVYQSIYCHPTIGYIWHLNDRHETYAILLTNLDFDCFLSLVLRRRCFNDYSERFTFVPAALLTFHFG